MTETYTERERDTCRETHTEKHTHTHIQTYTYRETHRKRHAERHIQRHTQRHIQTYTYRHTHTERHTERQTYTETHTETQRDREVLYLVWSVLPCLPWGCYTSSGQEGSSWVRRRTWAGCWQTYWCPCEAGKMMTHNSTACQGLSSWLPSSLTLLIDMTINTTLIIIIITLITGRMVFVINYQETLTWQLWK